MDYDRSYEPMDIDLSNSINEIDESYESLIDDIVQNIKKEEPEPEPEPEPQPQPAPEPPVPQTTVVKKYHINLPKDNKSTSPIITKHLIISVLVTALSLIFSIAYTTQCLDDLDVSTFHKTLNNKLFGQQKAVKDLINALSATEKHKIIFLYGGTGVGKTYTSSILMEQTKDYYNVNHYTMPSFVDTFTTNIMLDLYICKKSVIIVDDLTLFDKNINVHVNNIITKSKNLDKNVTIILIYNCQNSGDNIKCDKSFTNQIMEDFKDVDAFKKFIMYENLNETHLRMCMESELKAKVSDEEFHKFMKNFQVSVDGCKGVHTKMKLETQK